MNRTTVFNQKIKIYQLFNRSITKHAPAKPTWDLLPNKELMKVENLDIKKLEKLSMLSIDQEIEKNIHESIKIVERLCNVSVDGKESLIYYDYLGACNLREDTEKYESDQFEKLAHDSRRKLIMQNARYKYDDYFLAPPSK